MARLGEIPERNSQIPVGRGKPSPRGVAKELQGNADSNAENFLREVQAGAEFGEAGLWSRFAGARWRELRRVQAAGPGRRSGAAGLVDAFGAVRLEGWQLARASLAASALDPRCLEMDHLGERASSRRERVLSGGERGKLREEELLSNNHLLSAQGRIKHAHFPESSTGLRKRQDSKRKDIEAFFFFFLMEVKANLKSPTLI